MPEHTQFCEEITYVVSGKQKCIPMEFVRI